ncbi:hypothetical protein B0H34DRAFT_332280 [Crassisporium funariophilum]|nr:hypothetical protein B0H34DRAFT_332280 [Crassisporium funariophilum]
MSIISSSGTETRVSSSEPQWSVIASTRLFWIKFPCWVEILKELQTTLEVFGDRDCPPLCLRISDELPSSHISMIKIISFTTLKFYHPPIIKLVTRVILSTQIQLKQSNPLETQETKNNLVVINLQCSVSANTQEQRHTETSKCHSHRATGRTIIWGKNRV